MEQLEKKIELLDKNGRNKKEKQGTGKAVIKSEWEIAG